MTKFRPCIDLHCGKVKQIVGSTLSDSEENLKTNFETDCSSAYYANLYKKDNLYGGHVIMLGNGNADAAKEALKTFSGGLQVGGGITADNAKEFLDAGASHVIITSWIFPKNNLDFDRLNAIIKSIGKKRLVLDLSCKRVKERQWKIVINKWQTLTDLEISKKTLESLSNYCDEFLIHAAHVEGMQKGIDEDLIQKLSEECPIPCTYAGGAKTLNDLIRCKEISNGKIDMTIGSALDLFGGSGIKYADCVKFNQT